MAGRQKGCIDRQNRICQPKACKNIGEKESDWMPSLIQYLQKIEVDPELENFYPELSNKEDCIDQHLFRETDLPWSGLIQECDVCISEKHRYPGCTEMVDCISSASFENISLGKDEKEKPILKEHDVMEGVEASYREDDKLQNDCNNSLFTSKDKNESVNHKSDLGFQRNFQSRKSVMMRDKEGCVVNFVNTEKAKSSSQVGHAARPYTIIQTTSRASKKPLRSKVEINMVSASKRQVKKNCEDEEGACDEDTGPEQLSNEVLVNGDGIAEENIENCHNDDSYGITRDENGIMNEFFHQGGLANLRESDGNKMPVAAIDQNGISIDRQTKNNSKGFIWSARQNKINGVKPVKRVPHDDDAEELHSKPNMPCRRERQGELNKKVSEEDVSELEYDSEVLSQKHLSVVNGVKPIDNWQASNCYTSIDCIANHSHTDVHPEGDGNTVSSDSDDWSKLTISKGKEEVANTDLSSMDNKKGVNFRCMQSGGSSGASVNGKGAGAAVIKSTKPKFANLNGFRIDDKSNKSARTKQTSEAQPESIVNVSIDSNDGDGNSSERKNKWMIEIVDHDSNSDNISFSASKNRTESRLFEKEHLLCGGSYNDECSKKDERPAEDKTRKTIKCLGNLNPVLENRRPARKSIEKDISQKCIVNGDLQEKVKDDLSSSKMWRKNPSSNDTARQPSTSGEKSKLFYQGQGVQLRLNIKKPSENLSNVPKDEQARAGEIESQGKKIVSTAKAVSVKSIIKADNTEGKCEDRIVNSGRKTLNNNDGNKSQDIASNDDLEQLDKELLDILNYEPPKLVVPVVGTGHVEFDLKRTDDEESLKMENTRLSKLLLEVEQARSATVKALLSANSVLHKVNDANTELEGTLKTLNTDKKFLELELEEYKDKIKNNEKDIFSAVKATEFESSMKVIISSWKKEKQELLSALAKSSMRVKRVEADAEGLRVAFQRVKDQLENSNQTFNKLLEHNLQASVKVEEELKGLKEEKAMLSEKIAQKSGDQEKLQGLEDEIIDLKSRLESSNDEKDELCRKIGHLEKKNKQYSVECEELQEQLEHSQEIVDKLADKEEELKQRLTKEISEKEYLQGCLDETGQILLHLRNNEKKLLDEKDELEEDLEEEMQVNESLQQSLKSTMKEHQALVNRLQDMTNIHLTVKESLDQASKKEKSYQQQIASLNKTNSILHYSLEKEKEEKMDLQEMYENSESQWKIFKHDRMLEVIDMKKKLDDLTETEAEAKLQNEKFGAENEHLRDSLEHEEEENESLRKRLARLEQWKETNEGDLERLREERDAAQSEADDLRKRVEDLTRGLQKEKGRYDTLMCSLEDTEESLDKSLKDLSKARDEVEKLDKEMQESKEQLREKTRKVRELEIRLTEEIGEKDRILSRSKSLENEVSKAKKIEEKQRDEIETCQMHVRRLEREKVCLKKALDESKLEFDTHKERCVENFQKLREELVGVQNQLVEKDRQAMKQKENWQDAMENTAADLKMLRDFLGGNVNYKSLIQGNSLLREVLERDGGADIEVLRRAYQRAESELMKDVCSLEGMLKVSKEQKNTVAIVQSPMSKIKLSEIKKLRDEMYELNSSLLSVRNQISNIIDEVLILKNGEKHGDFDNKTVQEKSEALLKKLKELDSTITKIECDHEYVIEKNSGIINQGIAHVSRETTSEELDSSGESAYEGEESVSARKEMVNSQLLAENARLKRNIEFLQKKFQPTSSNDNDSDDWFDGKGNARISKTTAADDTTLVRPVPSQKYVPPTSMRYPPRYGGGSMRREHDSTTGHRSGYQSNDSGHGDRIQEQASKASLEKQKKPSYFAAEMSLFHHDDGIAANILRRKLQSKHYLRESKSDTASIRSSGSFKNDNVPRSHRSGSVEDDDENDEDSDLSAGELRRSKTLPRRFKSRAKFV